MNTKINIIDTYLTLGVENGFDNISLSMITDKIGIKKPSFYSHFSSFSELENASVLYCMDYLSNDKFELYTKADNMKILLEFLFGNLIDLFSDFKVYALYCMALQKKSFNDKFSGIYTKLENMVNSRILVALDYCVQRSWTDIKDTDTVALLLAKAFLSNPEYDFLECTLALLHL